MLLSFAGRTPRLAPGAFIAPTAILIGDVVVEEGASVWFGCTLRADGGRIHIGARTNVQDHSMLHADVENPVWIGESVTIGHAATVHACTIDDGAMVGIGAIALDGAIVGAGAVVAAGALVPPGRNVPPETLVRGVPAREVGSVPPDLRAHLRETVEIYHALAQRYAGELGSAGSPEPGSGVAL